MKRIYLIFFGLLLSYASFAIGPITGPVSMCSDSSVALSDITSGGTWGSSNPAVAAVGSLSGIVNGISGGTATITYSIGATYVTVLITVNAAPLPITGSGRICTSATTMLSDASAGGSWYSSDTGVAGIDSATGVLTGISPGISVINYVLTSGCGAMSTVTIDPTPSGITGGANLCGGSMATLGDAIAGGIWSSSNPSVATIGAATGVISCVGAGMVVITYSTSCGIVSDPLTVYPIPPAITGAGNVCSGGGQITLSDAAPGGVWSSGSMGIATVGSLTGVVTGVSDGVVNITYSSASGCLATASVNVISNPNTISGPRSICSGATTTFYDAVTGGTWSGSNASIAAIGSLSGAITGISTGSVIITYTVAGYCSTYSPLSVLAAPSGIAGTNVVCTGMATALSNTTTGGAWASASPAIASVGSASGIVLGTSAGTVSINYSLSSGCMASLIVTVNPSPAAIAGPVNACTGSAAITLSNGVSGGAWGSSNTSVATIDATGKVMGIASGTTTISYTLPLTGCFAARTETIYTSPTPIIGATNVCTGASAALGDAITGGAWSSPGAVLAIAPVSGAITGITPGTALVSYTIAGSCVVTATVSVNPLATLSGPIAICTGLANTYSGSISGGTWGTGSPILSIATGIGSAVGLSSGNAIITYSLPTGCISTKTVTVYNSPNPVSGPSNICAASVTTLSDATTGGAWHSSNPAVATVISGTGSITGISADTVTIAYTLGNGCAANVTLTVNPLPSAISGPANGCAGAATTLSDTPTGGYWSSSPAAAGIATIGSLSGIVTGISAGSTTITYTIAATGCAKTENFTIDPATPPISGGSAVCAGGGTITLADAATGGHWGSSNIAMATAGSTSGIVTGASAGTALITYMLGNGCIASKMLTINPLPAMIAGASNICALTTTTLSDPTPGGRWASSSFVASIGSSNGIVSGITTGSAIITYTLGTGCSAFLPFVVNPAPDAYTVTGGGGFCAGGSGVNIALDGSAPGIEYQLYSGGIAMGASVMSTGTAINFGTYTTPGVYTAVATNPTTGCTRNMLSSAEGKANPLPVSYTVTGGGSYCAGGTGMAVAIAASNIGIAYQLYQSSAAIGIPLMGTGLALNFGPDTGAGVYTVVGTNTTTGCSSNMIGSATISILPTVTPYIGISTTPGDIVCSGTPVTFMGLPVNGGTTPHYQWKVNGIPVGSDSIQYNYTPHNMDVVSVKLTSSANCAAPRDTTSGLTMTVNPYPAAIEGMATICQGSTAYLSDTTPGGTWASGDPAVALIATIGISTGGINGVSAGTSLITYIPATGCITTTTLTVNPLPVITASSASAGCGGKYILSASGGAAYSWSPAPGLSCTTCSVTTLSPTEDVTYLVTGTDAAGCSNTAGINISGNRISGHVTFTGAIPDSLDMMVWLIGYNPADSSVTSIDSTVTCVDGNLPYYEFDGKPSGNFMVRGKLLDGNNPGGSGYIPTYGLSSPFWDSAATLAHSGAFDTLHINLVYGAVTPGQGSISGKVYSGTGVAVGMLVFLIDPSANKPITYTYTNAAGAYSFNNLANGNYIVYPEDYVYYTTPSAALTLSSTINSVANVDFKQFAASRTIIPLLTNGIKTVSNDETITLYPNPTSGKLAIQWGGQTTGNADVVVTDVLGIGVFKSSISMATPSGSQQIDLGSLKGGVYFITVKSAAIGYSGKIELIK